MDRWIVWLVRTDNINERWELETTWRCSPLLNPSLGIKPSIPLEIYKGSGSLGPFNLDDLLVSPRFVSFLDFLPSYFCTLESILKHPVSQGTSQQQKLRQRLRGMGELLGKSNVTGFFLCFSGFDAHSWTD